MSTYASERIRKHSLNQHFVLTVCLGTLITYASQLVGLHSLEHVLRNARAHLVAERQVVLGMCMALIGSHFVKLHSLEHVLRNAILRCSTP